jgi:hypothetical protein
MRTHAVGTRRTLLLIAVPATAAAAALIVLNGCTMGSHYPHRFASTPAAPLGDAKPAPRLELDSPVPAGFADSKEWNEKSICPEGSTLSPFTSYAYAPGEDSHGFKRYFGRGCTIVEVHAETDDQLSRRGPASAEPPVVSLVPNGPYIWWYESGAKMESGTFDHGTLALGSSRYEPDGSLSADE